MGVIKGYTRSLDEVAHGFWDLLWYNGDIFYVDNGKENGSYYNGLYDGL